MNWLQILRDGAWVTPDRARTAAVAALIVTIACVAALALTAATSTLDGWGRPLGTDFSNVWTAGWMADHGRAADAWDWPRHFAAQQALHGRVDVPFYGWHYPPPFLLVAAALACLPYLPALLLWQGSTLLAALAVVRRIVPGRDVRLVALGFPAVLVCLGHGQNGFLTTALLGLGLLLIDRRPFVAGLALGCLVYKPQFAPMLPVLLIAGGHGRAILGAGASAAALVVLTTAIWGVEVWSAFLHSLPLTRTVVIEGANTGAEKIVSAFAAVRLNGGGVPLAYAVQAIVATIALVAVAITRRSRPGARSAVAVAAALLATPYAFDYDLVALGLAIAFMTAEARETGWRPWERSVLAFAWIAPLLSRSIAALTGVPIGLLAVIAILVVALRRGRPTRAPAST